ncbi:MAG TPA: hypothetical protein VES21_14605 [Nocardioidaceae bacterium]|nr:hypothetical protein [Nocardioidaceae bacterium]
MTTPDTTNPVSGHASPATLWEPPLAGTETDALPGVLGRLSCAEDSVVRNG